MANTLTPYATDMSVLVTILNKDLEKYPDVQTQVTSLSSESLKLSQYSVLKPRNGLLITIIEILNDFRIDYRVDSDSIKPD
jgi:hypothetical protein